MSVRWTMDDGRDRYSLYLDSRTGLKNSEGLHRRKSNEKWNTPKLKVTNIESNIAQEMREHYFNYFK